MKVGSLRHRVILQQLVEVKDSVGQMIQSWLDQGTYWAYLETITGREVVNAQQVKGDVTHLLKMRYVGPLPMSPGLLVSWRFVFQGRIFNILMVDRVKEIKKEYRIMAQEIASATPC